MQHVHVGTVGDGENVGRDLITALANVDLGGTGGVNRVTLVGIDGNTEKPRVGVDKLVDVARLQVVQYGSVVEVSQVGHVLALLELGGIHLSNQVLLEVLGLTTGDLDGDEVTLGALDLTLDETLLLIGNPASLLAIVGLACVNSLLFKRDEQELGGIGVGTRAFERDMARHVGGGVVLGREKSSQTHGIARTALGFPETTETHINFCPLIVVNKILKLS